MVALADLAPSILPLAVGVTLLTLAFVVGHAAKGRLHNLFFAGLYTLSGLKSLSEGLIPIAFQLKAEAPLFPDAYSWFQVNVLCAFFMVPLLLFFLLHFPKPNTLLEQRPLLGGLLLVPSLAFTVLFYTVPEQLLLIGRLFSLLAVAATLLGFFLIRRAYKTDPDPVGRTRARYLLIGFVPAFTGTWALTALEYVRYLEPGVARLETLLLHYVVPFLELAAAGITAYAILKYQLLGIELKVKKGFRYGLTSGLLLAFFFVTSNLMEEVVQPVFEFTNLGFLLSALVSATVFVPVQKGTANLTNRLFPETNGDSKVYLQKRAADIYHAQVAYVLHDANVTDREMKLLRNLRAQLGLSAEEAREIEQKVENMLHVENARTGESAAQSPAVITSAAVEATPEQPAGNT